MRKLSICLIFLVGTNLLGQGIPYGREFLVNTYTKYNQWHPKIAALTNGGFAVCWWSYDGDNEGVYSQVFSSDGNKICQEFRVNTITESNQWFSEIAGLSNGGFVVCWRNSDLDDYHSLCGQIFSSDGIKIGEEFPVTTRSGCSGYYQIASLPNGGFVVCWVGVLLDGYNDGMYAQVFSSAGVKIGEELSLCFPYNIYLGGWKPTITSISNGDFVVCWENGIRQDYGYEVSGQVFSSGGNKIGQEFLANTCRIDSQGSPGIAPLSNGDFMVCWNRMYQDSSGCGIYSQILSSEGVKIGTEFQVNTYSVDSQMSPYVMPLSNGHYVVCWMSLGQDGDRWGVYGQLFSSDGSKIGREFPVNTRTDGNQMDPQVARLPHGGFVVCWWGSDYNLYGQLFSSEEKKIGQEFHINADQPVFLGDWKWQVISLSDGDFVVCWETGFPSYGDCDVWAKRFPGSPLNHDLKPFSLLKPSNDSSIMTVNPIVTWRQASDEIVCYPWELHYKIYIDDNPDFNSPMVLEQDQDTTLVFRDLTRSTTYFWKVLAKNIAGDSLWSSNTNAFFVTQDATGVEEEKSNVPGRFVLHQNYPNPFNPETSIRFDLPKAGFVLISVYDVSGRLVRTLLSETRAPGSYSLKWDGRDSARNAVPSGIYVCKMEFRSAAGHRFTQSMKMGLVR